MLTKQTMLISVHKARRRAHRARTMGGVVSAATCGVDTDAKESEPIPGSVARPSVTLSEQTGELLRKQPELEASADSR